MLTPSCIYDVSGCQRLWLKVILQAVQDAESNVRSAQMRAAKYHAQAWLTGGSRDFSIICEMAGLNPQKAKQSFRQYFQQSNVSAFPDFLAFNQKGQMYVKNWQ